MTRFIGLLATEMLRVPPEAEHHPTRVFAMMMARSPANARKGLRMAVNDMIEMCSDLSATEVAQLDARLVACEALTLTEARGRFSRKLRAVLKRGHIKTEIEYYLVRNAIDVVDASEALRLQAMLDAHEATIADNAARH